MAPAFGDKVRRETGTMTKQDAINPPELFAERVHGTPTGAIEEGLDAELEAELPRWAQLGYEPRKRTRRSSPRK
jgi:hypothetical protein